MLYKKALLKSSNIMLCGRREIFIYISRELLPSIGNNNDKTLSVAASLVMVNAGRSFSVRKGEMDIIAVLRRCPAKAIADLQAFGYC
jgi:hypothetical protein